MSTDFSIFGHVTVDPEALEFLRGRPTWLWLEPAVGGITDDGLSFQDEGEGALTFTFDGLFRNLGRYLECDLALAQSAGDVVGRLESACTDGTNVLQVTEFSRRETRSGSSDCLNVTVELHLVDAVPFAALDQVYEDGRPEFHVLARRDVAEAETLRWLSDRDRLCWCGTCPNPDAD